MACSEGWLPGLVFFFVVTLPRAHLADSNLSEQALPAQPGNTSDADVVPNDEYRHLMHFVQVTDTHISLSYPDRASQLKEFISDVIMKVIKPPVVVMTGDIADSLGSGFLGTGQIVEEWQQYWKAVNETGVTRTLAWLDMRGNHDNGNLQSLESEHNFYRVYSVQGRKYRHSYSYTHQDGGDRYTFIGIDTCRDPGIKRPYNYVGYMTEAVISHIKQIREETRGSNFTIWFGHHPTRSVISRQIHELLRFGGPYLCGHYHTTLEMYPLGVYLLQKTGFLELVLADWKYSRVFRVAAVDHGLFSFVDVRYREWPIILVTNPKSVVSYIPSVEPLSRISRSTHIRVLVFSPRPIFEVRCSIDDGGWQSLTRVGNSSLWVAPWNTSQVSGGLHTLTVEAMDWTGGWSKPTKVTFSLDMSQQAPTLLTLLVLRFGVLGIRLIFNLHVLATLLLLLWFKAVQTFPLVGPPDLSADFLWCGWLRRPLHLLASVDSVFWPLVCLPLYLSIGPWFVAELFDGHIGVCFVWGTFIEWMYLPPGGSYFYAIIYMLLCHHTLVFCVTFTLWRQRQALLVGAAKPRTGMVPLAVTLSLQSAWAAFFYLAFGHMVILLGFLTVGTPVVSIVCWQRARALSFHLLETYELFASVTTGERGDMPIQANGKAASRGLASPSLVPSRLPAPPPQYLD
ncbi:transmembrane protein 62-like [Haemaphysalis longicornis]